ncbi:unnamed protein product [Nesidiocoris tenuis]|uniref:Uncharacterized protein n=2 Tax=Nesidiocoris tenuis TaxID=355587 RepID=A0A6H5GKU2_9HEMI|nr:Hypothetical protein NTJ_08066 [Nesidiocoris tenuis]CAB0004052.1 unnamed protein product [Nesidiocoris tenuis]
MRDTRWDRLGRQSRPQARQTPPAAEGRYWFGRRVLDIGTDSDCACGSRASPAQTAFQSIAPTSTSSPSLTDVAD